MATSFLDKTGLGTLWTKIKSTFALKSEIPDSTSDLTNDSGFITSANIPQSDWAQNDSTANDYVKNRVCYTGNSTMTEVFYSVIPTDSNMRFAEDGQISFTEAYAEVDSYTDLGGTSYSVTIGESTYTGTIQSYDQDGWFINIAGNPHMWNEEYTDNGMPFYTDFWVISVGDPVSSDTRFSLSLGLREIHKLDDKYLNGSLIKRGTGVYSVTLNGESSNLTASGDNSVAEGEWATASGYASHAEGDSTNASGYASHAEGGYTTSSGDYSHSEGYGTTANHMSQHVFGEYNVADPSSAVSTARGTYVEIVGNGVYQNNSNARTLDWNGNEVLAGKLTVGTAPTANMDVATKKYVDDAVAGIGSVVTYTLSITNNVITLTGSDGSTSSVTLPVYTGGVSS